MRSRRKTLSVPASLVLLAFTGAVPLLIAACKQPPAAVFDAGPPPAPTDAAPAVLVPLDEDSGAPDAADAAPPHHGGGGPGLSLNQSRAKQCCNALKAQAGTDPLLSQFVTQCNNIAMQMGPSAGGQAPEFAPLRQFLKGKNMPAVCQGL